MRLWNTCFACGLLLAAVLILSPRARAAGEPVSAEQIAALVRQLGSAEFVVRQRATRELIAAGNAAVEPLQQAALGSDAEVRVRARAILTAVHENDFLHRLEAFAADFDGSHQHVLPGWEPFSHRVGASHLARELFVEMQRAEPVLLEALGKDTHAAGEALTERTGQILDGQREALSNVGTLASLLFVASAEGVAVDERSRLHLYPYVVQSTYQRNHRSPWWPTVLKKIVGLWLAKDTTPAMMNQNLMFAVQLDLKPESLSIATRVLSDDNNPAHSRQMALLLLGHHGSQQHLPLVEKLLDDASACGTAPLETPPHQAEMQIRDVALAVLVQLTGQNLSDYGYPSPQLHGASILQPGPLAFAKDEDREAALKKWAQWRADHPQ